MSTELQFAVEAVAAACRLTSAVQDARGDVVAAVKNDRSPVTVADYGAQAAVCRLLSERFPADRVIAEEHSAELLDSGGPQLRRALLAAVRESFDSEVSLRGISAWLEHGRGSNSARCWVLDPVDGTKGFLRGEQYAVALGLLEDGELRAGVLGCPRLAPRGGGSPGCVFAAARGEGAFEVPLEDTSARESISVSAPKPATDLVLVESVESGHADHGAQGRVRELLGAQADALRLDSQAKYAAVARGDADVYLRLPNPKTPDYREKIWDHAAGALIVAEAGGRVTDVHGRPLDFTRGERLLENRGAVATGAGCHDAVLEAVREALGAADA
jgi:3'(2'), 5'-bisphosphate nucleotidase